MAKFKVGDKVLIDGSGLYNPVEILKVEEIPLGRRVNTFYTVKLSYGTKRVIEDVVRAANSAACNASDADDRRMWERIKGKPVYKLSGEDLKFYYALGDRIKGKSTGSMTEVEKAFWEQETNKVAKSVIGAGRGKYHLDPHTRAWTNSAFVSTAKDKLVAEVENRLGRELTMDEMFEIGSKARPGMKVEDVMKIIGRNSAACNASSSRNPVVANAIAWARGKACNITK